MPYFDQNELVELDLSSGSEAGVEGSNAELSMHRAATSIHFKLDPYGTLGGDPLSQAYIDEIKSLHEEMVGAGPVAEVDDLPARTTQTAEEWPFPWGTQHAHTVGLFLISYGSLIRSANLPQGARVLEVMCGAGALTWNLARMGYQVDAIDPNPQYCENLKVSTAGFPKPPIVIAATLKQWLVQRDQSDQYDAVIFFESFHRLFDHQACLRDLLNHHLKPEGKVILAAEPVFPDMCDVLPYRWGPLLDREAVKRMRKDNSVELGFTEAYLTSLFCDLGVSVKRIRIMLAAPYSEMMIVSRSNLPASSLNKNGELPAQMGSRAIRFFKTHAPGFVLRTARFLASYLRRASRR